MEEFDKNQAATPYRLQQARKRGQVARSPDLTGALAFLTLAAAGSLWGWDLLRDLMRVTRGALAGGLAMSWSAASVWSLVHGAVGSAIALLAPFAFALLCIAVAGNLIQTGPMWSPFPLKPDFNRLNPAAGLKRILSLRTLYDAAKSILKVAILGGVLYWAVAGAIPTMVTLGQQSAWQVLHGLVTLAAAICLKLAVAAMLLALIDMIYSRREFARKMRMSQRDLKDEVKHREGDPRIRSRLRGLRIEMLKKAAASGRVGDADVVIVNPTRYAVALVYKRGEMAAPIILAKGAGAVAARMRRLAATHNVMIVRNPPLARALYVRGQLDDTIPGELFEQVARVMVWVFAQREARKALGGKA